MSLFNYECDEVKRIIQTVSPNYPQLITYEREWIYFYKYGYIPGIPVELEYETVIINPTGSVSNAIPFNYKSAILKGNTKYRDIDTGDILDTFDETKNLELVSVQMPVLKTTGKNLWYGDKDVFSNGYTTLNMPFKKGAYYFTGDVDTVYPNGPTTIVFSNTFTGYEVGVYINNPTSPATLKEDCNLVKIYTNGWSFTNSTNKPQTIKNLMLSSTYPISYEPYQSNILTVNEDVTLRSNGSVYDELDLLTGKLTQRIDEDGSVLTQEVVKTVDLTPLNKPYEGVNHYHLTSNIPCELILEVPVVSTGEQTLQEINNY